MGRAKIKNSKLVAFGERVRALRKQKGVSQEDLAALAELDRSYLGHIERGEKNITLLKIYQLAAALECSVIELFPVPDNTRLGTATLGGDSA